MNSESTIYTKASYAWLIWTLAASFFFFKYLIQVSPSVMSAQLMQAFHLNGTGLGNLAACFFYAYLLMQLPAGLFVDKLGPRNLIAIGALACSFGIFTLAFTNSFYMAAISRFTIGLGVSFAAVSCFKLITIWFKPEKFAFMAGLSMTVAMLGAFSGEAPLAYLVHQYDWRITLIIIGVIGLLIGCLVYFIIPNVNQTEELNNAPLPICHKLKQIFYQPQNWLLSLYSGLAFAPLSVFGGLWGGSFLQACHGFSAITSAKIISAIFIGFAIGAPLLGWGSDKMQKRKPLMWLGTTLSGVSLIAILYGTAFSQISLIGLMFLFGFGTSSFFLCFSMIREINKMAFAGTVLGLMNAFDALCEALSEPLVGYVLDLNWHGNRLNGIPIFTTTEYQAGFSVLWIYIASALVILWFIKETHCKTID